MWWGSPPRPGHFTPMKETWYALHRRLGGTLGRSVRLWKISSSGGFNSRTVQPVAYAIPFISLTSTDPHKLRFLWWCTRLRSGDHRNIHAVWNLIARAEHDSSDVVRSSDGRKTLTVPEHKEVRYTRYYSHRMGLSVLLYPAAHDYFVATMFSNGVRVSRSACTSRFHDPELLLDQNNESIVTYSKVWRVWD